MSSEEVPVATDPEAAENVIDAATVDNAAFDREIIAQQERIREEDVLTKPYVGELVAVTTLASEFESASSTLQTKVSLLPSSFQMMRTTRPDGNCFYRGFAFGLAEWLLSAAPLDEVDRVVGVLEGSKDQLLSAGFDEFIDDFWDITMVPLRAIKTARQGGDPYSHDRLLEAFRDPGRTEYIVQYMRFLVSLHLALNADFFQFFIEGSGLSVEEFRRIEVEAVGRDADHVQITALTAYLGVGVKVVYLDQTTTDSGAASEIVIPDSAPPVTTLLYRPGHYDILYE